MGNCSGGSTGWLQRTEESPDSQQVLPGKGGAGVKNGSWLWKGSCTPTVRAKLRSKGLEHSVPRELMQAIGSCIIHRAEEIKWVRS